jgi:hypothetical protein
LAVEAHEIMEAYDGENSNGAGALTLLKHIFLGLFASSL